MRAPEPLTVAHPDLGNLSVLPYGQGRWLIDLSGPDAVRHLFAALHREHPELLPRPGWSSLLVTAPDAQRLAGTLMELPAPPEDPQSHRDPITVDVVYDGTDLPAVAALCGITVDEVISRHVAAHYRVVFLGFTRAFAYLDGLDPLLSTVPRLATPRVRVPAGSLGIAAGQTGIYPMDSPGGWHLLGRADARLFDADRTPPSLLQPGDVVHFRAAAP